MIARISPLRISNDTSVIAFTPPNASDTFSTDEDRLAGRDLVAGRSPHAAFSIALAGTG